MTALQSIDGGITGTVTHCVMLK